MPLGLPAAGILRTPANFEAPLKAFVDNLETATAAAASAATAASNGVASKYTKPSGGIPVEDLAAGAVTVSVRRYVSGSWQVRGTTSTTQTVFWVKTVAADPDPPINATFFLQGTDLLFKP